MKGETVVVGQSLARLLLTEAPVCLRPDAAATNEMSISLSQVREIYTVLIKLLLNEQNLTGSQRASFLICLICYVSTYFGSSMTNQLIIQLRKSVLFFLLLWME